MRFDSPPFNRTKDEQEGGSIMKALKVGLLVNSTFSDKYVYELALWGRDRADIKISHLIVHSRLGGSKLGRLATMLLKQGPFVVLSKILFRLIVAAETLLLKSNDVHRDHHRMFDLRELVGEIVTIEPIVSRSGFVYRFSAEDVEKIRALDFDVLIRYGSGIMRGDILRASRFGIISFHHGDNRINR